MGLLRVGHLFCKEEKQAGSNPARSTKKTKMSIFAKNFTVNDEGEIVLLKHLNQDRVDRSTASPAPGGWNKSGKKARINKRWKYKKERLAKRSSIKSEPLE